MKNVLIYIKLIDGTISYVPVESVEINKDTYKILNNDIIDLENDATSIWEYFPGDIVLCEERDGDLYACKLINSSVKNRRIHELIFKIVESSGSVPLNGLQEYSPEIEQLRKKNLTQKKHPIIEKWLRENE